MARQVRSVSRQDLRKTTLASDPAHAHLAVATRMPFKPPRAATEPIDRYGAAASVRTGRRSGQGLQTGATARLWRTSARGVPHARSFASALARQPTLMVRQIVSGPNCRACCDPLKMTEVEAGIAAVSGAMVQAAMRHGVVCAAARERHTERQHPSQLGRRVAGVAGPLRQRHGGALGGAVALRTVLRRHTDNLRCAAEFARQKVRSDLNRSDDLAALRDSA